MSGGTDVVVCIATYRRPGGLRRALDGLAALQPSAGADLRVLVVDNDAEGSGRPVVDGMRPHVPYPLAYELQPLPGISHTRNRAVAAAAPFDFLAFLDDDEVPAPTWLGELLRVQRLTGADVVTGPVGTEFDVAPPSWILRGGFFDRPRHPDAAIIDYARTGNVLMTPSVLAAHDPPFDLSFGLAGGEDTHFFRRAVLEGARIAWADHAEITEVVATDRVSAGWLIRREYRRGNTLSLCLRMLEDSLPRRLKRTAHAAMRIGSGAGKAITGVARGRETRVAGAREVGFGIGMLTGLAGWRYEPYKEA